jgi:aspartyl protease family protein
MGIYDRDYMKDVGKDPGKDWYNPKDFRGGKNGGYRPPPNDQQDRHYQPYKGQLAEVETPWVRPWLGWLFLWVVIGVGVGKAIEWNQARIADNDQKRQAAILAEQQKREETKQKAERVANNPYSWEKGDGPVSVPIRPQGQQIEHAKAMVLEASHDGHYFSVGKVNGFPVVYLVDTGATNVAVNEETAARAGITHCQKVMMNTAAGPAEGCEAMVESINFGDYRISNVKVIIAKNMQGHSLLGMNILRLFRIHHDGNRMYLIPK